MIGAFPWCLFLAFIGYLLGENWETIMGATHLLSYAVGAIVAIIILAAIIIYALVKTGVLPEKTVRKYLSFLLEV